MESRSADTVGDCEAVPKGKYGQSSNKRIQTQAQLLPSSFRLINQKIRKFNKGKKKKKRWGRGEERVWWF
ncbi:hypothetical protein V6N13_085774 [Hibiscus sabdariffa]